MRLESMRCGADRPAAPRPRVNIGDSFPRTPTDQASRRRICATAPLRALREHR